MPRSGTSSSLSANASALGDAPGSLKDGDGVVLQMYGTEIVGVDLPAAVELEVTYTEPGLQGDRSSAGRKPATVETGAEVQVPLFIRVGDMVKIDTRTHEYVERVNK